MDNAAASLARRPTVWRRLPAFLCYLYGFVRNCTSENKASHAKCVSYHHSIISLMLIVEGVRKIMALLLNYFY